MDISEEITTRAIDAIAADRYASDTTKYVEFAFFMIDCGHATENVYILAGLGNDSRDDKIRYFGKVLEELEIDIARSDRFDLAYAKSIAHQVIRRELEPLIGAQILERLFVQTNYDRLYVEFFEMSDGVGLLSEGYELVQGMTSQNWEEYIRHAFELFLEFCDLKLPESFYSQGYCRACGQQVLPELVAVRRKLFRKGYRVYVCPNCRGREFDWTKWNRGKDLYLEEIARLNGSAPA